MRLAFSLEIQNEEAGLYRVQPPTLSLVPTIPRHQHRSLILNHSYFPCYSTLNMLK